MENKHKEFKPFDRVLVKDVYSDNKAWRVDLYAHYDEEYKFHRTFKGNLVADKDILPYEGNERLVGTTSEPEEEVKLEKGKYVFVCDRKSSFAEEWELRIFDSCKNELIYAFNNVQAGLSGWKYAISFSDFNPDDMEETRKHILCVKNGKVVRYKE